MLQVLLVGLLNLLDFAHVIPRRLEIFLRVLMDNTVLGCWRLIVVEGERATVVIRANHHVGIL